MPITGLDRVTLITGPNGELAKITGPDGLIWESEADSSTFTLATAIIDFSITKAGVITRTAVLGSFEGTNYTDGQNIGINNATITLTGGLRVPTDPKWTNSGELLTITGFSVTQEVTKAHPTVTTNGGNAVGVGFFTANGAITALNGSTISATGFYYIIGEQNSNLVKQGTRITSTATQTGEGTFNATISGLTQGSAYSFLAFAESDEGTGFGDVDIVAIGIANATAFWAYTDTGSPYGGTAGTPGTPSVGDWMSQPNAGTTGIVVDSTGKPTSARCNAAQTLCGVRRTTTTPTPVTGASQDQNGVCVFTEGLVQPGLQCEDDGGSPATGDEGDTNTRTRGGVGYTAQVVTNDDRNVTNDDYVPALPEFAFINLGVSGSISDQGVISLSHSTGGGTLTHDPESYDPISGQMSRTIDVQVTGVTVPDDGTYLDGGATNQTYNGTYTTTQPAESTLAAPIAVIIIGDNEYTGTGNVLTLDPGTYSVAVRNDGGAAVRGKVTFVGGPFTVPGTNETARSTVNYTNATSSSFASVTVSGVQ